MGRLRTADAEKRADSGFGPDFLEALARGLKVLTAFTAERRQMTLADMARAVDLPRATVRRALYTLSCLGYVETDGRLFRLAPKILQLATIYLGANGASSVLQPRCERIAAEVQDACSAAVLDGDDVVMIAHAAPARFLAVGAGIGFRLPAFCTSLGRVLLASLSDESLGRFIDRIDAQPVTPFTIVDKSRLLAVILDVRRQGYAFVNQEAELGFRSVSVPVRRHDGAIIAALNIGARIERSSPETMRESFLPRLLDEAAAVQPLLV